jgi:hypothetical protein
MDCSRRGKRLRRWIVRGYNNRIMKDQPAAKPVERMFPFVLRSRALLVGRETLARSKTQLHFVLITEDISENTREEILSDFAHYPIVQRYTSEELERHFGIKGAKVIGFKKGGLAQSIYAEIKAQRINKPQADQSSDPPRND